VLWFGDLTEITTGEGKLYLACVLDMFSRNALGHAFSRHHDDALAVAAARCPPTSRTPGSLGTDRRPDSHIPKLEFDRDAVLVGAAIHDIGKTIHIAELSGPGALHEQAGYQLLLDDGIEERLARFARTHAAWTEPTNQIEDLLVSLADKVWKAKRVEDLEQLVLDRIVAAHGRALWEAFQHLDDLLDQIGTMADDRLAFQSSYSV